MSKLSEHHKTRIKNRVEKRRVQRKFVPPKHPDSIILEYSKAIIKEINKLDDITRSILIPELGRIKETKNERLDISLKQLSGVSLVAGIIAKIKSRFYGESLGINEEPRQSIFSNAVSRIVRPFLKRTSDYTEKQFVSEFERQTGTLPLNKHLDVEEFIKDATQKNISLIKTIPQQYLNRVQTLVENTVSKGQLTKSIQEELREIKDVTKNSARLIARDQVSKLTGVLTEARQRNVGVTEYIWRTSQDSRVRSFSNTKGQSDHAHLNGTIQKWSSPPVTVFSGKRAGERNHPSSDISCRCHAQAVYDQLTGIDHPDTIEARKKKVS